MVVAVLAAIGVLLVATGVLGAGERLPQNRGLGIRLRSTTRSDAAWNAAHRAAAPAFVGGGIAVTGCAVVGLWIEGVVAVGVVVAVLAVLWAARQAVKGQRAVP